MFLKINISEADFLSGSSAAGSVIPNLENMCASIQLAILNHMAKRLYRAFMFCDMKGLLSESNRNLVCVLFYFFVLVLNMPI